MGKIRVGINGFGRIGRVILRSLALRNTNIEVDAINIHHADHERMAYQFEYDSVFGRFDGDVFATDGGIYVKDHEIHVFSEDDPADINWASRGIDYVIARTGTVRTSEEC